MSDFYPKPYSGVVTWATEDLIEQNTDLVRRWSKAILETVKYSKENPSYAADLWVKRTNGHRDLADKAVPLQRWQPVGRGSGKTLMLHYPMCGNSKRNLA